jgi:hypothetical protein
VTRKKQLIWLVLVVAGCFHRGPDSQGALKEAAQLFSKDPPGDAAQNKRIRILLEADSQLITEAIENIQQGKAQVKILVEISAAGCEQDAKRRLYLEWDGKNWRPHDAGLLSLPAYTPRLALAKLMLAVEEGDCQTLLSLCPPQTLLRLGREKLLSGCKEKQSLVRELVSRLSSADLEKLTIQGDRAWIEREEKTMVKLIRLDDFWYLEDLF